MAITYAYTCKFCGVPNGAGANDCASCGRPAIARPVDVDHALGLTQTPPAQPKSVGENIAAGIAVVVFFALLIWVQYFSPMWIQVPLAIFGIGALLFRGAQLIENRGRVRRPDYLVINEEGLCRGLWNKILRM